MAFSFVLNRLLENAPWAGERLAPFAGETLELRAPPLPALRLAIVQGGRVQAGDAEPSLTMVLKPELLAALARGEEHALRAVEVHGNGKLAAEVLVLARHLRPDVEEDLSRLLGDVVAHRLVDAARAFAAWHLDTARRIGGALVDYATDEQPFLVRRAELDALAEPVTRLRDDLARLEKRLQRLE